VGETNTAVNALHPDGVLLVLVKTTENVEQLCLRNLWNQLDHVVKDNGGLLAHLGSLVLGDGVIHCHELLLVRGADVWVDTGEELHGRKLGSEALSIHQTLDHAHYATFEVLNPDCLQDFLDAFRRLT